MKHSLVFKFLQIKSDKTKRNIFDSYRLGKLRYLVTASGFLGGMCFFASFQSSR